MRGIISKYVENIVGKEESASYWHFLLFPHIAFKFPYAKDCLNSELYIKVPIAANWKGVCLQNTSKSHSYHLKLWLLL